ncbi:MAG: rod shape-determining protein RodA [candidate division Zixibacteria bacterium]|nr:rod shape-determining protein RodA [candidate division Zixibacteria bacterium]MDH3939227.1 rod shape-determining protein RodA [candidate division Zixibacteria bacterium]MDH4035778.1 rod shape-determining protein RodA [candidate division Zixibacteria bacterium]
MLNYRDLDWRVIGAALLLSLIGVLLIMSAQHHAESVYRQNFYLRQLLWLVLALVGFMVVVHLPLRLFDVSAYLFYGITLGLLVLVLVIGSSRMGATRWFSFGPINLAPSDVAKLAVVLALSRFFAYTKLPPESKRRLALSAILTLLPVMLILKQPDLGTSLVFWIILFVLWFWSGLSPVYLVLILSPLASLVAASHWLAWALYFVVLLVFLFLTRPGLLFSVMAVVANLAFGIITPFIWNRMADYQKLRILTFLDPGRDPRGAGYQIIQSKIAIGSGGIWGKGLLSGSQTRLDFLPERHTDFVFSVLGEEFGLWGALIVIILFGIIFYRAVRIAARCRSRFAAGVTMGAAAVLLFQFFVNVGMTLGFMPVTGLALPFLSYGGTSLMLTWTLIGLIVSADYRWQEY